MFERLVERGDWGGNRDHRARDGRDPRNPLLLSRLSSAVPGRNLQAGYEHHIYDLIVAIG
jgi:hypothetical protein